MFLRDGLKFQIVEDEGVGGFDVVADCEFQDSLRELWVNIVGEPDERIVLQEYCLLLFGLDLLDELLEELEHELRVPLIEHIMIYLEILLESIFHILWHLLVILFV